jgi:hypothetical protein
MMKPPTISKRKSSVFPSTILPSLCLLLVFVAQEIILKNVSSISSSPGSSAVMAFPQLPISSTPLPSTRIRSGLDDNAIETNSGSTPESQKFGAKQPQRRIFLEQSALVAKSMVVGSVSLIIPANSAHAFDKTESKIKTLTETKASAEGATVVIRKAKGGGLAKAIRVGLRFKMDELQRDLMQERWDLLQPYPPQLRSYVYIFTTYTDAAFPSDSPSDKDLRVALRYEVGRFYGSVERLKKAIAKQSLDEAYMGELS